MASKKKKKKKTTRKDARLRGVTILAAVFVLAPAGLARFGPDGVRQALQEIQRGVFFESGGRELAFDRTHAKFGALAKNSETTVEFRFENTSAASVRCTGAKTSCGCVLAELPLLPIPPGGSGRIRLRIRSKSQPKGPIWQLARVYTDRAPDRPYVLMVEGVVE